MDTVTKTTELPFNYYLYMMPRQESSFSCDGEHFIYCDVTRHTGRRGLRPPSIHQTPRQPVQEEFVSFNCVHSLLHSAAALQGEGEALMELIIFSPIARASRWDEEADQSRAWNASTFSCLACGRVELEIRNRF